MCTKIHEARVPKETMDFYALAMSSQRPEVLVKCEACKGTFSGPPSDVRLEVGVEWAPLKNAEV